MAMKIEYYPELDSLRAIAVFGVLFSHYYGGGPWGEYGVQLFFVLSGFLITSIIISHKNNSNEKNSLFLLSKNFYIRRTLRLFPIYYISLIIYYFMSLHLNINIGDILNYNIYYFLYLTNIIVFVKNEWIGPLSPYWSLAVEEQFYLLWFWVVLFSNSKNLLYITIFLITLAPSFRLITFFLGFDHYADYLLFGCVDSLGMGSLLAITKANRNFSIYLSIHIQRYKKFFYFFFIFMVIVMLGVSYGIDKNHLISRVFKQFIYAVVFSYVVYYCYNGMVGGILGNLLRNNKLIFFGKISYGIYVYHMLLRFIYKIHFESELREVFHNLKINHFYDEVEFIFLFLLTFLISFLSWIFIENPINKMKNKYSEGLGSIG